jgi:hypothetical protein
VNPANASALRTSRISCPWTLSRNRGSRVASGGAPFAGASGCTNDRILPDEVGDSTYLSWYIIVKVPGVLRVAEIGTKWCRVAMNIRPIDPIKKSVCLPNYVKRNLVCLHQHDVTLITSAPSKVRVAPDGVMKALRLACTIIEFGRTTELEVCELKRSSGSQSSCCIRSTASCDTRGNDEKRKVCFQFRIFCRVRWRYEADARGQN